MNSGFEQPFDSSGFCACTGSVPLAHMGCFLAAAQEAVYGAGGKMDKACQHE
jgi:hypothetical protein